MSANTVVFTAADGHVQAFPLQELLERGAVLADHVNGESISESFGGHNQLLIPGMSAKYYVRDVVAIDFEERNDLPVIPKFEDDGHDYVNRPNVSAQGNYVFRMGQPVHLEGYADDYDRSIEAVEFSVDGGVSWTRYSTEGTTVDSWVWWNFDWKAPAPGLYTLRVRSVNELGRVSPIAAVHNFEVI